MQQIILEQYQENSKQSKSISWSSVETTEVPDTWGASYLCETGWGTCFSFGKTKSEKQTSLLTSEVLLKMEFCSCSIIKWLWRQEVCLSHTGHTGRMMSTRLNDQKPSEKGIWLRLSIQIPGTNSVPSTSYAILGKKLLDWTSVHPP